MPDHDIEECHTEECLWCHKMRTLSKERCGKTHLELRKGHRLFDDQVFGCRRKKCGRRNPNAGPPLEPHEEDDEDARRSASPPASTIQPCRTRTPPVNYSPQLREHNSTSQHRSGIAQTQNLLSTASAPPLSYKPFAYQPPSFGSGGRSTGQVISSHTVHSLTTTPSDLGGPWPGSNSPMTTASIGPYRPIVPNAPIPQPFTLPPKITQGDRFTEDEDSMVLTEFDRIGPRWTKIAEKLKKRDAHAYCSRYNHHIKDNLAKTRSNPFYVPPPPTSDAPSKPDRKRKKRGGGGGDGSGSVGLGYQPDSTT